MSAIKIECVLRCSPKEAFALWTDSEKLKKWWGDDNTYRTVEWTSDLVEGGTWSAVFEAPGGARFIASGEYQKVVDPDRLVWTWRPEWSPNTNSLIDMSFVEHREGTLFVLQNDDFADDAECSQAKQTWSKITEWLKTHLAQSDHDAR